MRSFDRERGGVVVRAPPCRAARFHSGRSIQSRAACRKRLYGPWPVARRLLYIWSYRDRSLENDSRFPAKLSKKGPDNSKRIAGEHGLDGGHPPARRTARVLRVQGCGRALCRPARGQLNAFSVPIVKSVSYGAFLYGRTGCLTDQNGGFWPSCRRLFGPLCTTQWVLV
jgi:hypothetical protein